MTREDFKKLVNQALENLPAEFAKRMENVAVVVEDYPNRQQLASVSRSGYLSLFGLYEGVPKTKRGANYSLVPPDKITIFQKPIEYYFHDSESIKSQVRATVLHEIGHHFGMSEDDLQKVR